MIGPLFSAIRGKLVIQKYFLKLKIAKLAIFGQKTPILAIFMAKSRQTGKIQLDITYMNTSTPFHDQKTLSNLHFEFLRGSLLFSWHCATFTARWFM